jgi:hypothetical protein
MPKPIQSTYEAGYHTACFNTCQRSDDWASGKK